MKRDYFIKCKTNLLPNDIFYVFMTIQGNSIDAADIVDRGLDCCKSDIEKKYRKNVPAERIEILLFSLLQTTQ